MGEGEEGGEVTTGFSSLRGIFHQTGLVAANNE
jgi:hypothetical protein